MNTDKHRHKNRLERKAPLVNILFLSVSICVYLWLIFLTSCSTKPTDMRTLVPAETLVYLETDDLAAALQPIVDNKAFLEVAKSKPDFSALKGVQLAVVVTGFETSEEKLTDEHSVGRVQPHFVAVADTHSWNYQAVGFAEKKLGAFVNEIYDSEPVLEKSDKNGGKYFTWKAKDGRKAYALVIDSLIYFGNDETAIDKCLAVRRGETDSIAKAGKVVPSVPGTLASGYIGPDGIAQISNIIGLKLASEMGEDSEVQSAIAGILPQLLRGSVTDISWTSAKSEKGIEDKYSISMPPDIASVFAESLAPDGKAGEHSFRPLPDVSSATRYNFKDPNVAWRSLLLIIQKKADPITFKIFAQLANALFEPYGIRDPDAFFSTVDSNILTGSIRYKDEEWPFVNATTSDMVKLKKALPADLKPNKEPTEEGVVFWRTSDNEIEAVLDDGSILIGSLAGVGSFYSAGRFPGTSPNKEILDMLVTSDASISTIGRDLDSASLIVDALSERRYKGSTERTSYFTKTRFTKTGIDRRTTSDFGLIGSIIAQLAQD